MKAHSIIAAALLSGTSLVAVNSHAAHAATITDKPVGTLVSAKPLFSPHSLQLHKTTPNRTKVHVVVKPVVKKRPVYTRPTTMYDSTTPSAVPAHKPLATYATGGYAQPGSVARGHKTVWIDATGTDPRAQALDIEPGDAVPSQAGQWAAMRLREVPHSLAIVYCTLSEWPAVQASVRADIKFPEANRVRYWIADPTGRPHIVPGAAATQWYWGQSVDISSVRSGWRNLCFSHPR